VTRERLPNGSNELPKKKKQKDSGGKKLAKIGRPKKKGGTTAFYSRIRGNSDFQLGSN